MQDIEKLKRFFSQPGINKSGICSEVQISQQHLNRVLSGKVPITEKFISKLIPVLELYGYNNHQKNN